MRVKRWVAILLAMIIIVTSSSMIAFANGTTIAVESKEVAVGEKNVSVAISLSDNRGIAGMLISVRYDSALTLTNIQRGTALSGLDFTPGGNLHADPINLLWDGMNADKSNGTLVTLTFTAPQKAGTYPIQITANKGDIYDNNLSDIAVSFQSGEIKVIGTMQSESSTAEKTTQTITSTTYTDVALSAWYHDAVAYVQQKGLMSGTGATTFAPESTMTRAMLMTVLARYAGEDTSGGATWYEKGMNWAKANSVSDGTNPNGSITREQLVTMLYRYEKSPTASGTLLFADAGSVSAWAKDAMRWATGNGIITGMSDSKLAPQATATRAQVATILMRFCELKDG